MDAPVHSLKTERLLASSPLKRGFSYIKRQTCLQKKDAHKQVQTIFMSDFERALQYTLQFEGGYSNNPADPGGMTMRGIIQREYDAYRRQKGLPTQWVKKISDTEVRDIYYNKYWLPIAGGRIWPLNAAMFDAAVNSGPANAEWMLARAKALHPDHAALAPEATRQLTLAYDLLNVRRQFFRNIVARRPASGVFLAGWLKRCDQLQQICSQPARSALALAGMDNLPESQENSQRTDDIDANTLSEAAD